jgi:hypothetical protein
MSVTGCDPDVSTFTILITMSRSTTQCRAIYERMLAQGITPDAPAACRLIHAALKCEPFSIEFIEFVLSECWQHNVRPERAPLRLLIKRRCAAARTAFAARLLTTLRRAICST